MRSYSFGSPLFEKAVLNMPNGRKFMVITEHNSAKNSYIQSVELKVAKPYLNSYIAYDDIVRGGTLKFAHGPKAAIYHFGSAPEHRPYNETRQ